MASHPGYGEPRRSIRIPDELWRAALATAAERKETVPEVVRRALERYVARHRLLVNPDAPTKETDNERS